MILTFYVCGRNVSRNRNYIKNALICILVYTLGLGLRFGRGYDYGHYIDVYIFDLEESQFLFTYFNQWLKSIGVGQHYFFLFYNLIEITCAFVFLYPYRKYAKYFFPLFMVATLHLNEYSIRQGLAFSFVFLCFFFYFKCYENGNLNIQKRKYILMSLLCAFVSYGIHSMTLIPLLLIFIISFFRKPISLYVSITGFLLAYYVFQNAFDITGFNQVLTFMANNDQKYSQYIEQSDMWFGASGFDERYNRNPFVKIFETVGNISLLLLAYKIIFKKYMNNRQTITLYNAFAIGIILQKTFMNFEILNRVAGTMSIFWYLPLGLVLYNRNDDIIRSCKILKFLLIWWSYEYLKYLFMCGDFCKFLWDTDFFII